ncbi:DUF4367 domain-containing protein [Aminicella lysinilytica]|uniref:Uncharacterized protein DUF4367 n=1 Tax=Aminicella lysinilytica TaxID=433323 RepID=A0A4R6Q8V2_9FIRM|nr:DUF4367 domain-containing protein [Aminicella lysinilytica]NLD10537.1 DUF4367 domain-containing protein [Clostridiales bacterium]TDP58998.1 uncharacterized protein DUF4367 [Aminicella lysinilytica]
MNQLIQALTEAYNTEFDIVEECIADKPEPAYPKGFMDKVLSHKRVARRSYVHVSHFAIRKTILIAIIISTVLVTAITSIAITRPQIFYEIQQKSTEWIYHFRYENPSQVDEKFTFMVPDTPKGYKIVSKDSYESGQTIEYMDDAGHDIVYSQTHSKNLETRIDAEYDKKSKIKINGFDAIVVKKDDAWMIMWNDGISVFELTGIAKYSTLVSMANSVH